MTRILFAAALMLAAGRADAQAAATVPIALQNFFFAPSTIRLAAGRPVRLLLTNRSGSGHDFTARTFFRAASAIDGPVRNGSVDLAGHATVAVTLVPARGTYPFKCTHFGHKIMGMAGTIVVE